MKVFRIIPELGILRKTFPRKSASENWSRHVMITSLVKCFDYLRALIHWTCKFSCLKGILQVLRVECLKFLILEMLLASWPLFKGLHLGEIYKVCNLCIFSGPHSAIGSESDWWSRGLEFDSTLALYFVKIYHEIFTKIILLLQLILLSAKVCALSTG